MIRAIPTFVFLTVLVPAAVLAQGGALVPRGDEGTVHETVLDEQNDAVVAAQPGGFVVVWESYAQVDPYFDSVFLRLFDTAGAPLTGEIQVNVNTFGDRADPAVAVRSDGSFVVVWDSDGDQDGGGKGIFGRLFDSAGIALGVEEFQVNGGTAGNQNDPVVAAQGDGSFMVAWESYTAVASAYEVVGRRFTSDGTPIGNDFPINVHTSGDQEDVAIGVDAVGRFVVVWESDGQDKSYEAIAARRLASDGSPLGGELVVNTYTPFWQANPVLAVQDDGSFVVVWEDYVQASPGSAIFGRVYDGSDDPVATTGEFQVDTYSYGGSFDFGQYYPSVDFLANGNFVVVWASDYQDGSGTGVFRGQFDTGGNRLSAELQVNTSTAGFQIEPQIAVGGESALVVWADFGVNIGDVRRQLFAASLFADGFETGDTSVWSLTVP